MYGEYLPQAVCAGQQWSMKLKVRAVHGQLNDGGFDSQRYAIAQHQPLTGRFLQASVIEPIVACVHNTRCPGEYAMLWVAAAGRPGWTNH